MSLFSTQGGILTRDIFSAWLENLMQGKLAGSPPWIRQQSHFTKSKSSNKKILSKTNTFFSLCSTSPILREFPSETQADLGPTLQLSHFGGIRPPMNVQQLKRASTCPKSPLDPHGTPNPTRSKGDFSSILELIINRRHERSQASIKLAACSLRILMRSITG